MGCKKENNIIKINYHKHGKVNTFYPEENIQLKILDNITELISNSNDILKLLVNESTIEEIKNKEIFLEIIFEKYQSFSSSTLSTEKVKKILFPLSGDFIGNNDDPVITIFLGDKTYFSGPYRNENGFKKLIEIKHLVE